MTIAQKSEVITAWAFIVKQLGFMVGFLRRMPGIAARQSLLQALY
tara:strand:+ start:475 stop:609 length:135 start_codon:yes stop_codon:yes gene_type:complete